MKNHIMKEIENLSVAERIQLVQDIWDSVADEAEDLELSQEEKIELDKRLDDLEMHPEDNIAWEKVKTNFFKKL